MWLKPGIIAAASTAAATFIQPYNRIFLAGPGDSRRAMGGSFSGTYGVSTGLTNSYSSSVGTAVDGFLASLLDNRIRLGEGPNFGVGGQSAALIASYPRPVANAFTGSITGSVLTITGGGGGDGISVGTVVTHSVGGGLPVSSNVTITSFGTGTGGSGTYNLSSAPGDIPAGSSISLYYVQGSKTIADAAANEASIIILWAGTNGVGAPSEVTAMDQMINGLTDPSYIYPGYGGPLPLYNGQPKTLIVCNETRRGVSTLGASNQVASNPSQFHDYAMTLKRYSFDSGDPTYANPHVVVVDTFDDPKLADLTDTTNYVPLPGFFADGLHPALTAIWTMDEIIRDRVDPLIPADTDFARLPDTTTIANFYNPNGCFTATTGGATSLHDNVLTGTVPSGWQLTSGTAGVAIDSSFNALGGNLGNEWVVHISGTPSANLTLNFNCISTSTNRAGISLATDTLRASANTKLIINSGSVITATFQVTMQNGGAGFGYTAKAGGDGAADGYGHHAEFPQTLNNPYVNDQHTDWLTEVTPNCSLTDYATSGTPSSLITVYKLQMLGGVATDITVHLSQVGVAKVTD